jgi:CheY-like chemotaxis protein
MEEPSIQDNGKQEDERRKKQVLVVDGNIASQFLTNLILQRLEYFSFSVKTGEDALALATTTFGRPDVVLTEITLPYMSGVELLKRLKQDPRTAGIPVLVCTSLQDPAHRQACEQAGCSGYLVQPVPDNQLYETIQLATEAPPRRFVRLSTVLDVIVGTSGMPGNEPRKGKVTAISENGIYVNMIDPLPQGTQHPMTLFLHNWPGGEISIKGKVLYCHDGKGGRVRQTGMGVKFTQIASVDSDRIKAFIRDKLREGVAVAITS